MLFVDQVKRGDPRLRCLTVLFFCGFAVLLAGLWYVQIVSRQKYENSLKIQSFRTVRVPAARGRIFDRDGQVLADNQPRYNINLFLEDIRSQFTYEYTNSLVKEFVALHHRKPKGEAERSELARIARYRVASNIVWQVSSTVLPFPLVLLPAAFEKHYTEKRAIPMPIVTDLTPQQMALFMERAWDLPGIELEVEPYRFYPYGSLAAHALGYVQRENKEDDALGDIEMTFHYRMPDYDGVTGLEGGFNQELRGAPGAKAILVNNVGYRQSEETWQESMPGKNIVLTLDLDIQKAAERALLMSGPDTRGAAVVLDCKTGDILALASAPSYDLNMFVRPRDFGTNEWARLHDDVLTPQYNRALQGAYHPGSIFKIIVALAGFEAGMINPADTVTVPPDQKYWLGRRSIKDTAKPGSYDFKEGFKHSCNCYFIDYGLKIGVDRIVEMGSRFNLGEKTGVVQPSLEQRGYFPQIGQRLKQDGEKWTDGDTANLCIGQGEITVTPLQMALMTAAVANGGKLLKPRLVVELEDQRTTQRMETIPPAQIEREIPLSPRSLNLVRSAMLADVEEEGGTGKAAYIPGMGISGKTGTAQVMRNGRIDHITWFVSFAPFQNPKYAVVVVVESGVSGGGTCAPKAKEIYKTIQRIDNDRLKRMAAQ
jgi:penicillin-binding protein 2